MRYYDAVSGRHIDCDVIWSGKGASPAELRSREAWLQREAVHAAKFGSAKAGGDYITQDEARGKGGERLHPWRKRV